MVLFHFWCKFHNTPQMRFLSAIIVGWWQHFGRTLTQEMAEMCSTERPQIRASCNKQLTM